MLNGKRCVKIDHNKVKGLLVGINYRGTRNELGGCINDVKAIASLIKATYPEAQLEIITDDTLEKPTRENILTKLKKLVDEAEAGDLLIFDYSGHGSQVPDLHGDELDGLDETICPIDFMKKRVIHYNGKRYIVDHQITNDEINAIITNVPKDAKFLMLSDSCHSGTIGELKNDFLNYAGPDLWPNQDNIISPQLEDTLTAIANPPKVEDTLTAIANPSELEDTLTTMASTPQVEDPLTATVSAPQVDSKINKIDPPPEPYISYTSPNKYMICQASWIYITSGGASTIWLTPQRYDVFKQFKHKKHVINIDPKLVPEILKMHRNRSYSCKTIFNQLAPQEFMITASELGITNLKININHSATIYNHASRELDLTTEIDIDDSECSSNNPSFNQAHACMPRLVTLPNGEQVITACNVRSHFDPETGNHEHINYTTGSKNMFRMSSHNCCHGGELRIISGCQENQTSADTGKNGACTLAFLEMANKSGGLDKLLLKVFSHNVQDLKYVQDYINSFLMKHGFTQQSMVSWDHSTSTRVLFAYQDQQAEAQSLSLAVIQDDIEDPTQECILPEFNRMALP